jgi:hypothetical protein
VLVLSAPVCLAGDTSPLDGLRALVCFPSWFLLAESHLTRRFFGAMVRRIELLPVPAG